METGLFKMLFSAQGLGVAQTILLIALLWFSLFRKGEIKELRRDMNDLRKDMDANSALLRKDMDALRLATQADVDALRKEIKNIKENDLFHTKMAILLLAQELIKNKERFERIKDMLLEATPDSKKPQMQAINFDK
jgi:hypothetical protein